MYFMKRAVSVFLLLAVSLAVSSVAWPQAQKPLSEADLVKLIEVGLEDAAVVGRIEKLGLSFAVDDAVLGRLKKAGASNAVLAAVQKAAKEKKPDQAITLDQVLALLKSGTSEGDIKEALKKSPTTFTLGKEEVAKLKGAGASEALIKYMQELRGGVSVTTLTDLAIILDCSGSMEEKTPDGETKMEAAKKVLNDIIPKIPDGMRMTFVIYGHDKLLKCEGVKVVRPLSPLDSAGKAELRSIIAGLQPVSSTPIALSLRVTGKELAKKADALCGIILITDGVETCKGDPAAEAEKLTKELNLSFGVNVVGFGLNEQESKAVKEIADRGKGKYYPAKNARQLNEALDELVKKVPEPVVTKEPVTPQVSTAPVEEDTDGVPSVHFVDPGDMFPKLKLIALVKAGSYGPTGGASYDPFWEVKQYGVTKRKPADADKFDIYWHGEGVALPVLMVKDFSFKSGKILKLKLPHYLGFVKIVAKDLDKPKLLAVTKVDAYGPDGGASFDPIQTSAELAKVMVVPVGSWDIWFQPASGKSEKMRAKFKIEGGRVTEIK